MTTSSNDHDTNSKPAKTAPARGAKPNPLSPILDRKDLPAVSLVCSDDEVRLERAVSLVVDHFSKTYSTKIELRVIHGRELTIDAVQRIAGSVGALSLFATQQLLVVKQADQIPAPSLKRLTEILPRFTSTEAALFTATDLPSSNPLSQFCSKAKTLIKLEKPKGHDLSRWVERELRTMGITDYSEQVVQSLIALGEGSLDTIVRSIDQLSLYVEGATASSEDMHTLFVHRFVPGEFEMVDAIAEGKVVPAELGMLSLLREGKSAFMLLAILSRTFSNYLLVKILLAQGISTTDARTKINMTPWLFQKVTNAIRRYSFEDLLSCLQAILQADTQLKSRSLGEEAVMSQLVHDLVPIRG